MFLRIATFASSTVAQVSSRSRASCWSRSPAGLVRSTLVTVCRLLSDKRETVRPSELMPSVMPLSTSREPAASEAYPPSGYNSMM